jgi:hypothetical protein
MVATIGVKIMFAKIENLNYDLIPPCDTLSDLLIILLKHPSIIELWEYSINTTGRDHIEEQFNRILNDNTKTIPIMLYVYVIYLRDNDAGHALVLKASSIHNDIVIKRLYDRIVNKVS